MARAIGFLASLISAVRGFPELLDSRTTGGRALHFVPYATCEARDSNSFLFRKEELLSLGFTRFCGPELQALGCLTRSPQVIVVTDHRCRSSGRGRISALLRLQPVWLPAHTPVLLLWNGRLPFPHVSSGAITVLVVRPYY